MQFSLAVVLSLVLVVAVQCGDVVVTTPIKCSNVDCSVDGLVYPTSTSILLITGDHKVFRSVDEGMTFTQQMGLKLINRAEIAYSQTPNLILFFPTAGTNLSYSIDGGATIQYNTMPFGRAQLTTIVPHPTKAGWILLGGCTTTTLLCTMYVTKNYGQTWTSAFVNTLSPDGIVAWGNSTSQPELIFLRKKDATFGYTLDFGFTFTPLFSSSVGFYQTNHYMFVSVDNSGQEYLYASSYRRDPTHTTLSSYVLAYFPFGDVLYVDDFAFLDDTTRAEYIAVHPARAKYGSVFTSELDGNEYQLSIDYVYQDDLIYDFHRFRGLPGIYITNVVTNPTGMTTKLATYITFDDGGDWKLINPPSAYPDCKTSNGCGLHLHGYTSANLFDIPAYRTHSSAIGLIIANGNVGNSLDDTAVNTFFSRDAGLTWNMIYPAITTYEFGDHGGILVMAAYYTPVNYVMVSFDQGLTFTNYTFGNTSMFVSGITCEPLGSGQKFLITGDYGNSAYLYSIDFSGIRPNICQDSDYENWSPSNGVGNTPCFMGQTTVYTRRKQSSVCYNDRNNTDVIVSQTPCPCTYEDYECASNYQASARDATGAFTCTKQSDDPPCIPGTNYNEPTGFNLIPDTNCQGGLNLLGAPKVCPASSSGNGGGDGSHPAEVAAGVIISLLLIGAAVGIGVLYWQNERFRNFVQGLKDNITSGGRYREINNTDNDDMTV